MNVGMYVVTCIKVGIAEMDAVLFTQFVYLIVQLMIC